MSNRERSLVRSGSTGRNRLNFIADSPVSACCERGTVRGPAQHYKQDAPSEKRSALARAGLVLTFGMGLDRVIRRRVIGAVFVLMAIAMLVCGQTVLPGRLSPVGFLFYWLFCLVFTCLAILIAFRDAREVQQKVQREHRALLDDTLKTIEGEARQKKRAVRNNGKRR